MPTPPLTDRVTPTHSDDDSERLAHGLSRVRAPLLTAGALGVAVLALHLRDPHQSGSWGYCPFFALTGLYCPGCGGLRAVNDLTHGDLVAAVSSNLVLVAAIPLLAWLWARWLRRSWQDQPGAPASPVRVAGIDHRVILGLAGLVLLVGFTVLRNTAAGAWLAP
ncbi:MAG: DUF2752 domain-containing protein [Nocardioidaceae bacterium]